MARARIASNVRETSRLQQLVKVLQQVHRMLREADQDPSRNSFEPHLQGSSEQNVFRIKGEAVAVHLQPARVLICSRTAVLETDYGEEPACQMLERVFVDRFCVHEE